MNRRRKQEVSLRGDDEILIAAHPAKTLAGEIELIKAGLLYGQTVRLISPGAMYLAAADSVRSMNVYELRLLFDDFGLVDIDAATRLKIQSQSSKRGISTKELQRRRQVERELQPMLDGLDSVRGRLETSLADFELPELRPAIQQGIVIIDQWAGLHRP